MSDERLHQLIDCLLDGRLSESDQGELVDTLRRSAEARRVYWELVEQDTFLQEVVRESAGRDLVRLATDDLSIAGMSPKLQSRGATPTKINIRYWLTAGTLLLSAVIGVVFAVSFWWPESIPTTSAPTQESVASLHSLTGDVWLSDPQQRAVKVTSGQRFFAGDKLQVGEEGEAEVLLADGSRLVLGADSVLRFAPGGNARESRVHLERGVADVDAARQLPTDPLVISTEQARLVVLGTRFRLYAGTGDSRVELEEGRIQFERKSDGESVEVSAGQYAVAVARGERPLPLLAQPLGNEWRLRQTLLRAGNTVAFSPNGEVVVASSHTQVKVWSVATGEVAFSQPSSAPFNWLAFTPAGDAIVGLANSGQLMVWRISDREPVRTELKCEQGTLRRCAVSRDGHWLAQTSSVQAGYLPIWHLDEHGAASRVRTIPVKASSVAIVAPPSGPLVAASSWDGTTVKWNATTGEEVTRHRFRSELYGLALSADGELYSGYSASDGLVLVGPTSGPPRILWPPGSVRASRVRFTQDGRALFAAMDDGIVRAWSTEDGRPLVVLPTGDTRLMALDVSSDGNWLATAGDGGNVKIWQLESN